MPQLEGGLADPTSVCWGPESRGWVPEIPTGPESCGCPAGPAQRTLQHRPSQLPSPESPSLLVCLLSGVSGPNDLLRSHSLLFLPRGQVPSSLLEVPHSSSSSGGKRFLLVSFLFVPLVQKYYWDIVERLKSQT